MNTLLEKYSKKVQLAESVYVQTHNGEKMDNMKKMTIAKVIDTTSKFMNEAMNTTAATQRSAFGDYKKFAIALTNVGLPSLISYDLVTVSPMASMSGNIAYIEYTKGTTKGQSQAGDLTNGVFKLGDVDVNYTGNKVVELVKDGDKVSFLPATIVAVDGDEPEEAAIADDGTVSGVGNTAKRVAYVYDNEVVPQSVLPTLKAELKNIPLFAKPRRIAIYFSQIAAFQAKTDYGFNLSDGLAEQAVGQIAYETDTEVVEMLYEAATADATIADFAKTQPVGVSIADHYAAFAAKIEEYKMAIYDRTKKFAPTFMVIASDIVPILQFVPGFQAASVNAVNGPYMAGTVSGLKVFVSPMLPKGELFLGVNQGAMQASCGVYAPYMACVPTQLVELADGSNQQGWCTLYDAKILNADLLIKGRVVA